MRGHVRERGKGNWYAVLSVRDPATGKRKVQFRSLPNCKTKREAQNECARLVTEINSGSYVGTSKATLREWAEHWISIGCPGSKRRKEVGQRSIERYAELLRLHALPTLGERPMQQLRSTEIDTLYVTLADKVSPRTALHVHSVLNACLGTAARTRQIARNPIGQVIKVPSPGEPDHGVALDQDELRKLLDGFKRLSLFPIVAVAAFTGARRGEILALQWDDLDITNKTLRIERAIDDTDKHGLRIKGPKTERGKRTITIDDDLFALLLTERERHLRIVAGIPDGAAVDLSLVKLPPGALIFPSPGADLTKPRHPRAITKEFAQRAKRLGFPGLRFHDLRGTHETLLLDAGVPVHTVAARCGHDPAVMLRSYAKRTRKADISAATVIGAISKGTLGA
jgi:integrase